jgi:hypothetical protein
VYKVDVLESIEALMKHSLLHGPRRPEALGPAE